MLMNIVGYDQLSNPTFFIARLSSGVDNATGSITDLFNKFMNGTSAADEVHYNYNNYKKVCLCIHKYDYIILCVCCMCG